MRIIFLAIFLSVLYSCNNDLNTIGDTLVPAEGYVDVESFNIETFTVQLDSFPTSLNVLSNILNSNNLIVGRMSDKVTGITQATPYFQIMGKGNNGVPNYDDNYVYDSLTLTFPFDYSQTKVLAGDTTTVQTFRVFRLNDYPRYDYDDPCIYNDATFPYDKSKPLGELSIRLERQFLSQKGKRYIKLDDALGMELFNLIRSQDSLLEPANTLDFIRYFNGLTIVPDENNMALLPIDGSSLQLRCHYHLNENPSTYSFNAISSYSSGGFYAFTNIEHDSIPNTPLAKASWKNPLPFSDGDQAVIQGLNGYMMKMILPFKTDVNTYRTILKVEIVLEPKVDNFEDIPEPSIIQVFTLDKYSRITGILTDLSGNPVYGYPEINPNYKEDRKYRIDITDYYNSIVSGVSGGIDPVLYLLVGLQGTPVQVGTREIKTFVGTNNLSFQRLIIDEVPTLRIYYANY